MFWCFDYYVVLVNGFCFFVEFNFFWFRGFEGEYWEVIWKEENFLVVVGFFSVRIEGVEVFGLLGVFFFFC